MVRLIPFEFGTTQTFMIAAIGFNTQTTIRFVFYQNQQVIDNINNGDVPYLDFNVGALTGVTNFDITKLNFAQSADTLLLVHENFNPIQLKRGIADNIFC